MERRSIDDAIESLELEDTPKSFGAAIPHSPLDWNDEDLMNLLEDEEIDEVTFPLPILSESTSRQELKILRCHL